METMHDTIMDRLFAALGQRCAQCEQPLGRLATSCSTCGAFFGDDDDELDLVVGDAWQMEGAPNYQRLRRSLEAAEQDRVSVDDAVVEVIEMWRNSYRGLQSLQSLAPETERERLRDDGLRSVLDCMDGLDRLIGLLVAYQASLAARDWPAAWNHLSAIGRCMHTLQALQETIDDELLRLDGQEQNQAAA